MTHFEVLGLFFLRTLALVSLILGLERVCPRKGWPWPRIFVCRWPWPKALCPRLHIWIDPYLSSTHKEATHGQIVLTRFGVDRIPSTPSDE